MLCIVELMSLLDIPRTCPRGEETTTDASGVVSYIFLGGLTYICADEAVGDRIGGAACMADSEMVLVLSEGETLPVISTSTTPRSRVERLASSASTATDEVASLSSSSAERATLLKACPPPDGSTSTADGRASTASSVRGSAGPGPPIYVAWGDEDAGGL